MDVQNNHPQNHGSRTKMAFALAATPSRLVLVLVVGGVTRPFSNVRSHSDPRCEPEHRVKPVDSCKCIHVSEPSRTRPDGHSHEIDKTGDGEPALRASHQYLEPDEPIC